MIRRHATRTLLLLALCLLAPRSIVAQSSLTEEDSALLAALPDRIRSLSRALDRVSVDVDVEALSVELLAERLRTPEAASAWIRSNLRYEPYAGRLRGPRGTLFSRGGNSLDRALLLGALLSEMGEDWRLARATLSDEQSGLLLAVATAMATSSGEALPADARLYDPFGDRRGFGALRDYFWVQIESHGAWSDIDPTFPDVPYGSPLLPATSTLSPNEIPPALTTNVTFTLKSDVSGATSTALQYSADITEIGYRNLTIRFERAQNGATTTPSLAVAEDTSWGTSIALNPQTRIWIEVAFRTGERETRIVRDLRVAEPRLDLFAGEAQVFAIVILPGLASDAWADAVLSQAATQWGAAVGDWDGILDDEVSSERPQAELGDAIRAQFGRVAGLAMGVSVVELAAASDRLTTRIATWTGARPFVAQPRILIAAAIVEQGRLAYQIDLRDDSIQSLPLAGAPLLAAPALQSLRGISDSWLETTTLSRITGCDTVGSSWLVENARSAGATWTTLTSGTSNRITALGVSQEIQDRLSDLIGRGADIAVFPSLPATLPAGPVHAWWRIDPATSMVVASNEFGTNGALDFLLLQPPPATLGSPHVRVRTLDGLVSLIEHAAAAAAEPAERHLASQEAFCRARCTLPLLTPDLCQGGQRRSSPPALRECLRGGSGGSGPVPVQTNCSDLLEPLMCAATFADALASGQIAVTVDTSLLPDDAWIVPPGTELRADECTCTP